MRNNMRGMAGRGIWVILWLAIMCGSGFIESFTGSGSAGAEMDSAMQTKNFHTDIVVGEDQSYQVSENIDVEFLQSRHGIYRYVPYKGSVNASVPYIADITEVSANTQVDVSSEKGNKVFRLGSQDTYLTAGEHEYQLSYKVTPRFQKDSYDKVYYNVFPSQWQNDIPAGSGFTITFPKSFNTDKFKLFYGTYGEQRDAASILDLTWDKNTVTGVLKTDLLLGEGVTSVVDVGEGYFTGVHTVGELPWLLLVPAVLVFVLIFMMFLRFGRDEEIIPSIQYEPPKELDSASVGYIIDGQIEEKDLLSLIIYWADKKILRMEEQKDEGLCLYKLQELGQDAPDYQQTIFRKLFEKGGQCKLDSLKYKFTGTLDIAKAQLKKHFIRNGKDMIYTRSSKVSRNIARILCTLPFGIFILVTDSYSYTGMGRIILDAAMWILLFVGVFIFCGVIDKWYAAAGTGRKQKAALTIGVCFLSTAIYLGCYIMRVLQKEIFCYPWILGIVLVLTGAMIGMTVFMKKRTSQCVEWMGRLAGMRDFIETAELDRMNEMAKTNPEWFYHIIPYAYVFGLSDVFAKKLKSLELAAPDWYSPYNSYTFFDFYLFSHCMTHSLGRAASTLTVSQPPAVSGQSGGFGGGGFSGGGGGFSGGGFGGGGGGSW